MASDTVAAPGSAAPGVAVPGVAVLSSRKEDEICLRVESRYPILYITTWEEYRALWSLRTVAQRTGRTLFRWTATEGLVEIPVDNKAASPAALRLRPDEVLSHVIKQQEPNTGIYVLQDFHSFLDNPEIIRRLRDVVARLRTSLQTVIILSPVFRLPVELEKDITLIDYDLPSAEDLKLVLERMIKQGQKRGIEIQLSLDDREQLVKAMQGLTETQAENVLTRCMVRDSRLDTSDIQTVLREKEQVIKKSGILEYFSSVDDLGTVGGLDILKDWFRKRKNNFTERARQFGLDSPKGVLLIGVPGCGKSLCAKALAAEWDKPLLRLDVGRIFEGLVGRSEENMRMAIKAAESVAPVILWIDEIEKGFAGMQGRGDGGGVVAHVFGTLVTWMQEKTSPVFIVATANDISQLPPELIRKGRFDELFFVDLPSQRERVEIFNIHIKKCKRNPNQFDVEALAQQAEKYSGAEIESVVKAALNEAFSEGGELTQQHLVNAAKDMTPLSETMSKQIDGLRNWAQTSCRWASTVRQSAGSNLTYSWEEEGFVLGPTGKEKA